MLAKRGAPPTRRGAGASRSSGTGSGHSASHDGNGPCRTAGSRTSPPATRSWPRSPSARPRRGARRRGRRDGRERAAQLPAHPAPHDADQRRVGRAAHGDTPVDYMVFDLLHLDGHSTRDLPYAERRELLESLELEGPRWHTPRHRSAEARICSRRRGARVWRASWRSGSTALPAGRPQRRVGQGAHLAPPGVRDRRAGSRARAAGRRVGSLLVGYYDRRASELRGERQAHLAGGVGSGLKEDDIDLLTRELKRARATAPSTTAGPRGPKAKLAQLVRARACLRGHLERVDRRGHAAPARLQGHARRQGRTRGRA